MTARTIYIHIGIHKTGTSAIQQFLSANREILRTNGFLYPGTGPASHLLGHEILKRSCSDILADPESQGNRYRNEIERSPGSTVIVSSESFCLLPPDKVADLGSIFSEYGRIKIIAYLRRQDERLESGYNQMVREQRTRLKGGILDLIHGGELERVIYDYYALLDPWRRTFGAENIIIRCYEKEQMPEEIYLDFCRLTGIPADDRFRIPPGRTNQSLHWDLIECIRLCNTCCTDNGQFQQSLVSQILEISPLYNPGKQQHLLSPQQRMDIIGKFEESNAKVAREYLHRPDGRLFFASLPDLGEPWAPYEGLTLEKIVPLFFLIAWNHERKQKNQIKKMRQELDELKKRLETITETGAGSDAGVSETAPALRRSV